MDGQYTIEELGARVKAKYPQYKDIPDAQVGAQVVQKYPQYQKNLIEKPQDQGNPILNTLGKVFAAPIHYGKAALGAGYEGVRATAGALGDKSAYAVDEAGNPVHQNPFLSEKELQVYQDPKTAAIQGAKDIAGTSAWVLPGGNGVKGAVGYGAVSGGLQAASEDNATPMSVLMGILSGGATGGVLTKAGEVVGPLMRKGMKAAGDELVKQGNQLALRGLRPSPSQATKFKQKTGQDIADYVAKQGWSSNFAEEAKNYVDELQNAFDDIAINSNKTVSPEELKASFAPVIEDFKSNVVPSVNGKVEDLEKIRDGLVAKYKEMPMTVGQITEERRNIDALLKDGQFSLPPEASSYLRSVRDALQETVRKATSDMNYKGMDLKKLGIELRNAYAFKEIAEKQANLGRGNRLPGLLDAVYSGTGATIGAGMMGNPIVGAILGTIMGRALGNKKVVGAGVKTLRKTGEKMQGALEKQFSPQLMDLLMRATRGGVVNQTTQP